MTKKAYDYLKEYGWIGFYIKHLYYFDFLDFFDYFEGYDGDIEEISLKYLDEHIELAIKSLDFNYIIRSYNAKSEINHMTDNLENALKCDMRILILNMNPICLDYNLYPMHIPLDVNNVANLKKLKSKFGEEHILNAFNENWNFMRFNSTIIQKMKFGSI